jgi:hypothetical protein
MQMALHRLRAYGLRIQAGWLSSQEISMVSFFRKLKTDASAAPLHYAIIVASVSVALLIALKRLL